MGKGKQKQTNLEWRMSWTHKGDIYKDGP